MPRTGPVFRQNAPSGEEIGSIKLVSPADKHAFTVCRDF